jgi:UDP-N-acetylmuramyl pentapeptide phosphotransferase/UDP-N-acetylglucosamine-1-phosphate transferase
MMTIIFALLSFTLFLVNYFFLRNKILIDKSINFKDSHKKFINNQNKNIPLSGGFFFLILLIPLIFLFDPILIFLFFLIYVIGLLSDIHYIKSPKIRIILQFFTIFILVVYSGVSINDIRINSFNHFLSYQLISILFTVFCILVLINGSNFIDGVNTLLCGYILAVLSIVIYVSYKNYLNFNQIIFQYFALALLVFFIFNFLNKCFLGDSGAYIISSFLGFNLILFFIKNNEISPYFIIVLLWYPAFENLFSIFKRIFFKKKTYLPDNTHLHHKIFLFLSKKFNLKNNHLSTITGLIINFFNFLTFLLASQNIYYTQLHLKIILFNVTFYLITYYFLSKRLKN